MKTMSLEKGSNEGINIKKRCDSSSFLVSCLSRINVRPSALVLDLPSGVGRHFDLFRQNELEVVAADLDARLLELAGFASPDALRVVLTTNRPLPFRSDCFDIVAVIHPVSHDFLPMLSLLIRPGGYLVFETFGAQGNNAVALPRAGEIAESVAPYCRPIRYLEKRTRKMPDRVTVKALFKRDTKSRRGAAA